MAVLARLDYFYYYCSNYTRIQAEPMSEWSYQWRLSVFRFFEGSIITIVLLLLLPQPQLFATAAGQNNEGHNCRVQGTHKIARLSGRLERMLLTLLFTWGLKTD